MQALTHCVCVTEFADAHGNIQTQQFSQAHEVIIAHSASEVLPCLQRIERATQNGAWAVGYVAYEAAAGLNPNMAHVIPPPDNAMPLLAFALFDAPDAICPAPAPPTIANGTRSTPPTWQLNQPPSAYADAIARIRHAIELGSAYQINYTLRAHAATDANFSLWHYYQALKAQQQCNYAAYLDFGTWQIASLSPELFFDWDRTTQNITTRPMKGTIRRGRTPEEDKQLAQQLRNDPKERAENVMIVDLLRNDLGRIAETGSVQTTQLLHTEAYPTLWQMTSTVQATTQAHIDLAQIMQALFPCGSITGAPKQQVMQHIAELENTPRGIYCGAIGIINPQRAVFNVAIRTLYTQNQAKSQSQNSTNKQLHYGVGGGITWSSTAANEFTEAQLKMQFLDTAPMPQAPFALLETVLLHNGQYALLDLHLQRLTQSAHALGFRPISRHAVQQLLKHLQQQHPQGNWRISLTQSATGQLNTTVVALDAHTIHTTPQTHTWNPTYQCPAYWLQAPTHSSQTSHPVALAAQNNQTAGTAAYLLQHKTTQRQHYEAALAQAQKHHPKIWDTILHNANGYATEYTRGNIVLQTQNGYLTPPNAHGLLAGTLRQALLDQGTIQEAPISIQRLQQPQTGDVLWFINSVRGWQKLVVI